VEKVEEINTSPTIYVGKLVDQRRVIYRIFKIFRRPENIPANFSGKSLNLKFTNKVYSGLDLPRLAYRSLTSAESSNKVETIVLLYFHYKTWIVLLI
jgi:hypothetical protein